MRYRVDEASENVGETMALGDLARRASELALVPTNYQSFFTYLNSIRSPRKHGRGPRRRVAVEIGPAESLLMGNHARALLIYLGQRP